MFTPQKIESMIRTTGGVPVVLGAVSTWGHRETTDEVGMDEGAEVSFVVDTVKVATGILTGLRNDAAITVAGEALKVGEHRRTEDGAITVIELQEP